MIARSLNTMGKNIPDLPYNKIGVLLRLSLMHVEINMRTSAKKAANINMSSAQSDCGKERRHYDSIFLN